MVLHIALILPPCGMAKARILGSGDIYQMVGVHTARHIALVVCSAPEALDHAVSPARLGPMPVLSIALAVLRAEPEPATCIRLGGDFRPEALR